MIVDYNFRTLRYSTHVRQCVSAQELAYRLWNNFRWRGYIDPDMEYIPSPQHQARIVSEDLMVQLEIARTSGLRDRTKLKDAKENFLRKMYLTISQDMFKKLLRKYRPDFKFYGYKKLRNKMFSLLQNKNE